MLGKLVIRIVINAIAVWVAAWVTSRFFPESISLTNDVGGLLIVALLLGVVNAFIKPIVSILTCPINLLTLGLFTLVINALMLMLVARFSGGNFSVDGFGVALVAAIIISIVSSLLSMFLSDDR